MTVEFSQYTTDFLVGSVGSTPLSSCGHFNRCYDKTLDKVR